MKIVKSLLPSLLIIVLISCSSNNSLKSPSDWSQEQVSEWINQKEWLGETELQPGPSFDQKEFAIEYHKNKAEWDKAFDFLKHADLSSLTVGVHELDGQNVFVKVTEYDSKVREDVLFEAHKNYADIHYIVTGAEYIDLADLSTASLKTPYNAEKDIAFYEAKEKQTLLGKPGTFFIIFANDLHRSGIEVGESEWVKKIVIKIKN